MKELDVWLLNKKLLFFVSCLLVRLLISYVFSQLMDKMFKGWITLGILGVTWFKRKSKSIVYRQNIQKL